MQRFRICLYFCHASFDQDLRATLNSLFFFEHNRLSSDDNHPFDFLAWCRRTLRLGTNGRIVHGTHMSCQTSQAMSMFVVPWMAVKRGAWLRALSIPDQSAREKSSKSISLGPGLMYGSVVSTVTQQLSEIGSVTFTFLTRSGRVVAYRSMVLLLCKLPVLEKRVGSFTHCERPKPSSNWNSQVPAVFVWESQVLRVEIS